MSLRFKHIFSFAVVLLVAWAGFNFSFSWSGGWQVNEAHALNVWGDWFDRTVGQRGFTDIGFGRNDPRVIIANVVNIAFGLLGVIAIVLMMYAGFLWMTAAGNSDKIEQAKAILRNAAIGLLIILSAFAVAIYILSRLMLAAGGNGLGGASNNERGAGALGALGAGIVQSVYPAPEQRDVPRNTAIIITFREAIDPASLCDQVSGDRCAAGAKLNAQNVRLYQTDQGDQDATNLTAVQAASVDNRTFIFTPEAYLGSPSEKLWYSVALTADVKKSNGAAAFSLGGFQWKFEVSNLLDLTPPQVMSGGVFPMPDNAQDTVGAVKNAVAAKAAIEIKRAPQTAAANSVAYVKTNPNSDNPDLNIPDPADNTCDGQIDLAINNGAPLTANVAYRQMSGKVDSPQAAIVNRTIVTACGFKVVLDPGFAPGHSWRLTMTSAKSADYLLIGNVRYKFVADAPQNQEILIDNNNNKLAANIKTALAADPAVRAETVGNQVILTARTAGTAGNTLSLLSSAADIALALTPFKGGADQAVTVQTADQPDQPKNAIIQINFNEPINPLTVSGPSAAVADFIRVVNVADNSAVAGDFILTNQYQTVEFRPANECGVNGCGDKIYCLPAAAQLKVELKAAALAAVCAQAADCAAKTPYNDCQNGVCADSQTKAPYPAGQAQSGIADLANNSLDGNRNGAAQGPVSFFNENIKDVGAGDSYRWSFWISDRLDLQPPKILKTAAASGASGVDTKEPVKIYFDKLMMASTLSSGNVLIDNGQKKVAHNLINLWSQAKEPIGYWISKINQDVSTPPDNQADQTVAMVNHSAFYGDTVYRTQVGSGVKDIYQNCFKPCRGPSCEANQSATSCCNGLPMSLGDNQTCP